MTKTAVPPLLLHPTPSPKRWLNEKWKYKCVLWPYSYNLWLLCLQAIASGPRLMTCPKKAGQYWKISFLAMPTMYESPQTVSKEHPSVKFRKSLLATTQVRLRGPCYVIHSEGVSSLCSCNQSVDKDGTRFNKLPWSHGTSNSGGRKWKNIMTTRGGQKNFPKQRNITEIISFDIGYHVCKNIWQLSMAYWLACQRPTQFGYYTCYWIGKLSFL